MIYKKALLFIAVLLLNISAFAQDKSILEKRFLSIQKLDYHEDNHLLALKKYKELVEYAPSYPRTYLPLIRTFIEQDKIEDAYNFLNDFLKVDSTNGYVYYCLSRLSSNKGRYELAISQLEKCISLNPNYAEAYGYNFGLGRIYQILGNDYKALFYYQQAITKPSDARGVFYYSLNEILNITLKQRNYIVLKRYLKVLIQASQNENIKFFKAWALSTYGHYKSNFGEYRNALNSLFQAIKVHDDPFILSYAYGNIGAIYFYLGEINKGLSYVEKQLKISKDNDLSYFFHFASINYGFFLIEKKKYNESLLFFKKVLFSTKKYNNKWFTLRPLLGIADSYFNLHNYIKAEEYYKKAIEISENSNDNLFKADIYMSIGNLYYKKGDYKDALINYKKCKKTLTQFNWMAEIGIGITYCKLDKKEKAIKSFNKALYYFDKERQHFSPDMLGNSFYTNRYIAYYNLIKLYSEERKFSEAFEIIEKYKSNSIEYITAEIPSLKNSYSNQKDIGNLNNQIKKLHLKISKLNPNDAKNIFDLQEKIALLELKKSYFVDSLNSKSGKNLTSLNEIQSTFLNQKTTLIQYIIGNESIFVFAIKKDNVFYKELNISRQKLAMILNNISVMYRLEESEELDFNTNILNAEMANFSISYLFEAYEKLIKPLTSFINNSNKLIIIPDDLLYYMPFDALVSDTSMMRSQKDFANARFLIEDYIISYASSATALKSEIHHSEQELDLLAFGNPDYANLDLRDTLGVNSNSYNRGMKNLQALPYAQSEVNLIGEIVDPFFSKIFTKTDATEDNFMKFAEQSKILHLATHFMTNDFDPIYSKIALSRKENSYEDGLLQPFEIYNMNLNADLAVLSACNTALGKVNKGQGIVGVSRSFQMAGVPSLVVSQWSVDDKATSIIMTSFYKYLKDGFTKSEALHRAKLEFLKSSERKYKDPFYWAPFVLIGNTEPILFQGSHLKSWIAVILIVIAFAGFLARKKFQL